MENLQRPEHVFVGNAGYGTPRSVSCPRGTAMTWPDWTPRAARFCPADTLGWISLFLSFFSYGAGDLLFLFLLMIPWVSNPNFPVFIILSFPHLSVHGLGGSSQYHIKKTGREDSGIGVHDYDFICYLAPLPF